VAGSRVHRRRDSRLLHDRVPERDQLRRGHGRGGPDGKIGDWQVRRVSRGGRVRDAASRDRHGRRSQRVRAPRARPPGAAGLRALDSVGAQGQVQFPDQSGQRAPGRRLGRDRLQRPRSHRPRQDETSAF